jgi:hypothetical protein
MSNNYIINEWALIRRNEMVDIPEKFIINEAYINNLPEDRIEAAFREIWDMFYKIYTDISIYPEKFGMPLYKNNPDEYSKYGFPPSAANQSKYAPFMFFDLLINIFISGELKSGELIVSADKLRLANEKYKLCVQKTYKIKNIGKLFSQLKNYGLYADGLINNKLTDKIGEIILTCPDNNDILYVLKKMADKTHENNRREDFVTCHYKLLKDDINKINYGFGADFIADKLHNGKLREAVYAIDKKLIEKGYIPSLDGCGDIGYGNGQKALLYYIDKKDVGKRSLCHFKLATLNAGNELILSLRIRNIQNCLEYLECCPVSLKEIILKDDPGCSHRFDGSCKTGQAYKIGDKTFWKCGCCGMQFNFTPVIEDIHHYIKLVEAGVKK